MLVPYPQATTTCTLNPMGPPVSQGGETMLLLHVLRSQPDEWAHLLAWRVKKKGANATKARRKGSKTFTRSWLALDFWSKFLRSIFFRVESSESSQSFLRVFFAQQSLLGIFVEATDRPKPNRPSRPSVIVPQTTESFPPVLTTT